ncbi:MAG: diaminopimelate decarboxylase [Oscillospiraceae bacterium]
MKRPFVTRDKLEQIAAEYPTPFYLYDEEGIRQNVRQLMAAFRWNAGYREYFAVKATPTPGILKLLGSEGCRLDCSSLAELLLAERCGFRGEQIMFSSNNTPSEEFRLAAKLGATINLDDLTHVAQLQQDLGTLPETISCRYNPGGTFSLPPSQEGFQVMDCPGDAKYGMTRSQLFEAFAQLKALGVKRFGLHAFLASNTLSNEYYPALARILFSLAAELQEKVGVRVAFVNLSGGVGVPYRPDQPKNDIAAIGKGVETAFREILVPKGMGDVAVYTELGRFVMAPFGALVTRCTHFKHTYKEYAGVDACAANLMRPAMYGAYHHITVMGKENAPCTCQYDVVGALCENNDKFAVDRSLPPLEKGDLLWIHDTGAHGHAMGYQYNGRLRSSELLLRADGTVALLRRAETPEDYFSTMVF